MRFNFLVTISLILLQFFAVNAQKNNKQIVLGIERLEEYLPYMENKKVAVVANQSSVIDDRHLVDILLENGVELQKVFSPEHGFRGNADAGEKVGDGVDSKTGLKVISLYGDNKKPTKSQLNGVEVIVFDLQDVGVRFYTYISTLTYVM